MSEPVARSKEMIGQTIGNYVVRKKIGEGGMGAVYLAEHPRIGRRVAIKVLHPQHNQDPQLVARFFNEARAASEIDNDHIARAEDFGELADGASYFVMEWLDGRSLGELMRGPERVSPARMLHILTGVCQALAAAHAHGIVHRDLKPDNIFVVRHGSDPDFAKVLDFGIAKLLHPDEQAVSLHTKTQAVLGTPAYMSPEQCRGDKNIDQRSDIYSLGVITYELATGRRPFVIDSLTGMLIAHLNEAPPAPRSLDPAISAPLEATILRALEKAPERRFQHIHEFLQALTLAINEQRFPASSPLEATLHQPPGTAATLPGTLLTAGPTQLPTAAAIVTAAETPAAGQAPAQRRSVRRHVVIIAAVVVVAAVAVAVGLGVRSRQPGRAAVPPPASPRPPPVAAPAAAAHVTIRTEPPGAALTLDGAPLGNPFSGELPRSAVRRLITAAAPGRENVNAWYVFDHDQDIVLVLKARPEPIAVPATRPARPAAPDRPAAKPPATKSSNKNAPQQYKGTKPKLITEFPE